MKYNLLGNTGLKVSELCLGTMTFGGRGIWTAIGTLEQQAVDELMKSAVDAGINFIDTANVYSIGLSEELTGKSIRNLGLKRDDLVIATKVRGKMGEGPNEVGLSRKHILAQVDDSLRRLNTDYIDLYQIHGYDALTPLEDTIDTLDTLVQSGKVRYIGASNLAAWHLMKGLSYSHYMRKSKFVSLQAYYTLAGRDLEREIIPLLHDQKVGLMVWSPLAGGFLSGKFTRTGEAEAGSRRTSFDFPPVNKEKAYDIIDVLQTMSKDKNASVAQLALAWLLHQKAVTTVIIGAKKPDQLSDNLKAVDVRFTPEDLQKLDEISKLTPEYPAWMLERQGADRKA
ncbi:aldo/keto reductase [Fulvivirgaceae bacterium PWU4]|uniref:Aldo/keto reductase n=1 Tax=Chryseosolibacter histidini TaxID=2782349 RepID=A0AAP2DK35_9BACT|nr:aldo/keto reductase [Chryseosolibacter histidini]MBT1696979.1 aldo/keto reductase [Chryseosolibacter histidini]